MLQLAAGPSIETATTSKIGERLEAFQAAREIEAKEESLSVFRTSCWGILAGSLLVATGMGISFAWIWVARRRAEPVSRVPLIDPVMTSFSRRCFYPVVQISCPLLYGSEGLVHFHNVWLE